MDTLDSNEYIQIHFMPSPIGLEWYAADSSYSDSSFAQLNQLNRDYYYMAIGVPFDGITFMINGSLFGAEEGMTWGEWVNSSYNTIGVYLDGEGVFCNYSSIKDMNWEYVNANHVISNGAEYYWD